MSPKDNVNLPTHYARHRIEPIRFLMENRTDPFQFNICKYVLRHDDKNGMEDLFKSIRYLVMYIRFLRQDPDWWKAMSPEDYAKFFEEGPKAPGVEGEVLRSYMMERSYEA